MTLEYTHCIKLDWFVSVLCYEMAVSRQLVFCVGCKIGNWLTVGGEA